MNRLVLLFGFLSSFYILLFLKLFNNLSVQLRFIYIVQLSCCPNGADHRPKTCGRVCVVLLELIAVSRQTVLDESNNELRFFLLLLILFGLNLSSN